MKTAPARSFPRPGYYPHLPSPELPRRAVEIALGLVLVLALLGAAWFIVWTAQKETTPAVPEARLELLLSGAVTSSLSLDTSELKTVQCSPSAFSLAAPGTAFPLAAAFNAPASADGAFYVLGSKGDFTLRVNGAVYTLVSGTVTSSPGVRTFNASFTDAQSQPLQLSGRLVCP